jgi:hypothetical protein
MELPKEVLLWLGHSIDKRSGGPLSLPQNPIEALKEGLEALVLAKYLIGGRVRDAGYF